MQKVFTDIKKDTKHVKSMAYTMRSNLSCRPGTFFKAMQGGRFGINPFAGGATQQTFGGSEYNANIGGLDGFSDHSFQINEDQAKAAGYDLSASNLEVNL